uniref:Orf within vasotocin gene (Tes1 element) n=1 Tax=Eptatretus stoutii TaxID=7765 RepID=Q7M3L8_EPTST
MGSQLQLFCNDGSNFSLGSCKQFLHVSQLLLISYKPSVCKKAVLEQIVLLHPLKHYLDNIALQEVVYCYHNGEKNTINKGRQRDHYNPSKCRSFLWRNCKEAKVSASTVSYTIKRHLETAGNSDRKRSGRPKATTQSEDECLRFNQKTIRRWQNKKKRFAWAMKHRQWTTENWKKALWTDESKFEIFVSSRRVFVRCVGKRIVPHCVTPTVKHGGGSLMIWGSFAGSRVGDLHRVTGTLNRKGYHSILQRHAIPSGLRLVGQGFILQQDNDPKHTSRLCQNDLRREEQDGRLQIMEWPAQSPDLNPIELVWDELDRRVKAKQPTSATHLWELLQQSREELSEQYLISIVERMPVCSAVISAKGGYFDESKISIKFCSTKRFHDFFLNLQLLVCSMLLFQSIPKH